MRCRRSRPVARVPPARHRPRGLRYGLRSAPGARRRWWRGRARRARSAPGRLGVLVLELDSPALHPAPRASAPLPSPAPRSPAPGTVTSPAESAPVPPAGTETAPVPGRRPRSAARSPSRPADDAGAAPRVRCARRPQVLRPLPGETILDAALRQGVPLASPCGGRAVCGDCIVAVVAGADAFPPPDADETAWRARKRYAGTGRLACRVRVTGDCTIATTYW